MIRQDKGSNPRPPIESVKSVKLELKILIENLNASYKILIKNNILSGKMEFEIIKLGRKFARNI